MKNLNPIVAITLLLGTAACESEIGLSSDLLEFPNSAPGELDDPTVTDRVVQVTTPEVDVLFVVDNSCSMQDEQDELGEEFPIFLDFFLGSGLDYHMGVTSTDLDLQSALKGNLVDAQGTRWIDATMDEDEAARKFQTMVGLGINGSGEEKGLAATYSALELRADGPNAGFYREEASLHTVMCSDENDQSYKMNPELISKAEFIDWYDNLKDVIEDRTFSSIVCLQSSGGDCIANSTGTIYMDVTRSIGGITWDIHAESYAELLEELGVQASGFKREYFLTQAPIASTLYVTVERALPSGDVSVSPKTQGLEEDGADYFYDESRNSVVFYEFVPEPLDEIVITYTLLSAAQDPSYDVDLTEEQ